MLEYRAGTVDLCFQAFHRQYAALERFTKELVVMIGLGGVH